MLWYCGFAGEKRLAERGGNMTKKTASRDVKWVTAADGTRHDVSAGFVVYDGPSMIDGSPILGIVTINSENVKTGNMAQFWILVRDTKPTEALKSGADFAVCGACPVRPLCYVNVGQGPRAVWQAFQDGNYPEGLPPALPKKLRLGAYGDPAAIPFEIVRALVAQFTGWTGYTHQWRTCDQRFRDLCMASTESSEGYFLADAMGWRTSRVGPIGSTATLQGEIVCPATPEGGSRTTCENCLLCSGRKNSHGQDIPEVVNVLFPAHGPKKSKFELISIAA
jgi:hypothetical protein